jgi:hypothetical protein
VPPRALPLVSWLEFGTAVSCNVCIKNETCGTRVKGGPESFEGLNTPEKIVAFFDKYYPTAIEMLGGYDAIIPQMLNNPVGLLGKGAVCFVFVRCVCAAHARVCVLCACKHNCRTALIIHAVWWCTRRP